MKETELATGGDNIIYPHYKRRILYHPPTLLYYPYFQVTFAISEVVSYNYYPLHVYHTRVMTRQGSRNIYSVRELVESLGLSVYR